LPAPDAATWADTVLWLHAMVQLDDVCVKQSHLRCWRGWCRGERERAGQDSESKAFALRRYVVFNAQLMGARARERVATVEHPLDPVAWAKAVMQVLKETTRLLGVDGAEQACDVPFRDAVR